MQGRAKTHPRPSWLVSRLSWLVPSSWALATSRSCDRGVSDLFLCEPKHGKRSIGGQARTSVDLLEADTGVPRDGLPAMMDDRVGWRKRAMGVD